MLHLYEEYSYNTKEGEPARLALQAASEGCGCCVVEYSTEEGELEFKSELTFDMVSDHINNLIGSLKNARDLRDKYFTRSGNLK